ncbi:hypothetical protein FLL45_18895 [Aliikangiella marina]|uniref:Uncharacterized protein n=1 Tax=Aliikangiella marina TaxID=1712262 RepID=A0A545T4W6_9GAMM|nr:hypothetical protein [Aliikangiella marina]TQV72287.1 hypothetical protein FLL45_18895 [Aliikangiella marina]
MVSKSFDLDEIKKRTAELSKTWQKKLNYLSESVSRSGMEGASHWLKSHHQIDDLKDALEDLLKASESEEFKLAQVETTFSSFVIPEEDMGQADWYRAASIQLEQFEKSLLEKKTFDKKQITSLINELKYISEANEFHERYQLQSIQAKVKNVYQNLVDALNEFKKIEREKFQQQKEQDKIQAARLQTEKAQAEAKKATMESVKIKEKRLAIIEEKKRLLAEKEKMELEGKQEIEMAEVKAKEAEHQRQAKLQDAYVDLQLEERMNSWSVAEVADILRRKASESGLSEEVQTKVNALIIELKAQ